MPKWILTPYVAIATSIAACLLILSLLKTDLELAQSALIVDQLSHDVAILRNELQDIELELQIATASSTQEKILRDELLLQKPGEYIVHIPHHDVLETLKSKQRYQNAQNTVDPQKDDAQKNQSLLGGWLTILGFR